MTHEKNLLSLVDQAYAAGLEPERWNDFLRDFATAVDAPTAHLHCRIGQPEEFVGYVFGRDDRFVQSYVDYYGARSPIANATRAQTPGSVHTHCELIPEDEFERTEFYQEWEKPQGLFHGILGVVERDDARGFALFGAGRSREAGNFGAEQIALVRSLVPHVRRAIELNRRLHHENEPCSAHAALVDALALGVIVLDGEGRVQSTNPAAARILERESGLFVAADGVLRARGEARTYLDALVQHATCADRTAAAEAMSPLRGDPTRMHSPLGGRIEVPGGQGEVLEVSVAPLEEPPELWGGCSGARALVLVSDGAGHAETTAERLRSLYRLTRAESDLCALLLRGKDLREAAERRSIKVSTARSQLKQVLAKTGTRRQSELLRRLLTHPVLALAESHRSETS